MFRIPSLTSVPGLMIPSAAFLIDMQMAAVLLVVPTMRLSFSAMPFGSVL